MKRRDLLGGGSLVLLLGRAELAHGATILAVRIWPAPDYSRVTIESDGQLTARQMFVSDPPRLAVDIEGIDINPALRELVAKVRSDDPNIAGIRVGQNSPNLVRMVMDLKQPVLPQVFTLPPVAAYQHRLVLDLYATRVADPLETLIAERLRDLAAPVQATASAPATNPAPTSASAAPPPATTAQGPRGAASAPPAADPLGELIAQRQQRQSPGNTTPEPPGPAGTPANTAASVPTAPANPPAAARRPTERPAPSTATGPTDRLIIVALDPGHGGEDPGAIGPNGTREKDVVLRIAHLLRERINAASVNGNAMRAYLTRDADFFVPLQVRVQKARRVQADLFVSIHADAFYTPRPQGASVFALSQNGASSSAARWMANRENQSDLIGGLNVGQQEAQVQRAMLDMSTTAQINDSLKLGTALLGEIGRVGKLHKPRVEQAGFAVLKAPDIPSVLVEAAFISNPDEEARLNSESYQRELADALMRGIERYFARNPPLARNRTV